jgi:hypothetical protein
MTATNVLGFVWTKLQFESPTAVRRHALCVGVGRDRTHAEFSSEITTAHRFRSEWFVLTHSDSIEQYHQILLKLSDDNIDNDNNIDNEF